VGLGKYGDGKNPPTVVTNSYTNQDRRSTFTVGQEIKQQSNPYEANVATVTATYSINTRPVNESQFLTKSLNKK